MRDLVAPCIVRRMHEQDAAIAHPVRQRPGVEVGVDDGAVAAPRVGEGDRVAAPLQDPLHVAAHGALRGAEPLPLPATPRPCAEHLRDTPLPFCDGGVEFLLGHVAHEAVGEAVVTDLVTRPPGAPEQSRAALGERGVVRDHKEHRRHTQLFQLREQGLEAGQVRGPAAAHNVVHCQRHPGRAAAGPRSELHGAVRRHEDRQGRRQVPEDVEPQQERPSPFRRAAVVGPQPAEDIVGRAAPVHVRGEVQEEDGAEQQRGCEGEERPGPPPHDVAGGATGRNGFGRGATGAPAA
mmetsp:Transcript_96005/g.277238  ORF Transcript_96005/g.277238 Transcript_96005/m.277238 type:complete len:293 (-) Transcript_96005:24-902(-)